MRSGSARSNHLHHTYKVGGGYFAILVDIGEFSLDILTVCCDVLHQTYKVCGIKLTVTVYVSVYMAADLTLTVLIGVLGKRDLACGIGLLCVTSLAVDALAADNGAGCGSINSVFLGPIVTERLDFNCRIRLDHLASGMCAVNALASCLGAGRSNINGIVLSPNVLGVRSLTGEIYSQCLGNINHPPLALEAFERGSERLLNTVGELILIIDISAVLKKCILKRCSAEVLIGNRYSQLYTVPIFLKVTVVFTFSAEAIR